MTGFQSNRLTWISNIVLFHWAEARFSNGDIGFPGTSLKETDDHQNKIEIDGIMFIRLNI